MDSDGHWMNALKRKMVYSLVDAKSIDQGVAGLHELQKLGFLSC